MTLTITTRNAPADRARLDALVRQAQATREAVSKLSSQASEQGTPSEALDRPKPDPLA